MRSPSSTKSVVRNGKKTARKKWRTSTKSVVGNGKKPREKNGEKKNPGGKKRAFLPSISRGHFFVADYLRSRKTGKRGITRSLYVAALAQPSKSLMHECALSTQPICFDNLPTHFQRNTV